MLERIKNEPVFVVMIAVGIILYGIDLATLNETVETIVGLLTLLTGAKVAREQVTPVRKLESQ